ncbi:MFS transporter, partial [Chloroflexota bacterium]
MTQERIYKDRNLQIICGVVLIGVMGVSSLSPALPAIREALNISRPQTGILIAAFTLPSVILVPFIGVLADRIGRKRLMVPSLSGKDIADYRSGGRSQRHHANPLYYPQYDQEVEVSNQGAG